MNTMHTGYITASINFSKRILFKHPINGLLSIVLTLTPAFALAIDKPGQPRGILINPSEIKWEWDAVPGAKLYDVIVNGVSQGQVADTHFYSRNLGTGEHHMSVKAIDSDWRYSQRSDRAWRNISASSASNSGATQSSGSSSSSAVSAPADPRGTEVRPGVMKWEWARVSGAGKYEVSVNGVYRAQTSDLYLYNHDLGNGEHSMTVRAVGSDGKLSAPSARATQRLIGASFNASQNTQSAPQNSGSSLRAPADPRGTEVRPGIVKWEWASVSGASRYEVYVDGDYAGETGELKFRQNLPIGEHFMTVKALSSSGTASPSSNTARVYVEGTASSQDAAQTVNPPAPQNDQPQTQATNQPVSQSQAQPAPNDTGLIDPQSWSQPGVNKPGYKLVFSDEFNADRLNRNRWNTQLRWDGSFNGERYEYRTVNGEDQFYVNIYSKDQKHLDTVVPGNNPFEFNGSRLAIRAKRNPLKKWDASKGYGPLYDMVSQQDFLSGAITTYDKFSQKYGYFEARIKIPKQVGTFPAFWLHHQRREWEGTQKTEIDIMENLGHAPHYVYTSFHYFTGVAEGVTGNPHFIKPKPQGQIYTGINYNEQYHVYAVAWEPGHLSFKIDGQEVSQVWNGNVNHEELYLILNLAIGGNWTNYPSNAGGTGREPGNHFPNKNDIDTWSNPALEIDYVRVYKRN